MKYNYNAETEYNLSIENTPEYDLTWLYKQI